MKKIIFLFGMFCFTLLFSQEKENKRYFPAEYVLKTSGDTIKAKVRNTGLYTNTKYSFATILFKMKMMDEKGVTNWVPINDVRYIKILDENQNKHEYFASTDKFLKEKGLVEVLYEGKNINWYKAFNNSILTPKVQFIKYLVDKDKNILYEYKDGPFDDFRQSLKKLFKDDSEFTEKLNQTKSEKECIQLLQLWDTKLD
ncbi:MULTISPECIES: hypothetical protein [unclassified Chryseobacterium]|uniref:hypothetical protein n=1 Tax=unclassified Chryseobacterium TaxID=2593645 RepID=UPI00100B0A8D|nr:MULTISPECIES: hypothetical protein [unclassified Chryseobacterium]RXM51801.1 hypothetical protein BOQ64_12910 [Chryseobacterium sp. CH25]RXM67377.1 hypothetical protein BOQ60_05625 [Chryseobacterium sp. CH1]